MPVICIRVRASYSTVLCNLNLKAKPDLLLASAGPRYIVAMTVNACTALLAIGAATTLRIVLMRLNKRLERGEPVRDVATGRAHAGAETEIGEGKNVREDGGERGAVTSFRFLV